MKFWKEVIRPGTYWPRDEKGEPFRVDISKDRIRHWMDTFKRMAKKNKIPIPYYHTDNAVPITFDSTSPSTYQCAGYALDAEMQTDGSLHVLVEPATEDDARNFNTKIRDVSIRTQNWKDGSGDEYEDAITHIAACYHPVMNDQKPFVPANGLALSLSMSYEESGSEKGMGSSKPTNSLEFVCEMLAEHGFDIGDDVTPENFIERLGTALRAVKSWKEKEGGEEDDFETRPEGAKSQKPTPIAMSNDLLEFSIRKLKQTPNNPETGEPWTPAELKDAHKRHLDSQPKLQLSAEHQAAYELVQSNNKKILCDRLSACVKNLTMSQDVAEEILETVEAVELKFSADGSIDEKAHRDIFIPLKMAEGSRNGAALNGMTRDEVKRSKLRLNIEDHPDEFYPNDVSNFTEQDADRVAKEMLASIGL